MTGNKLLATLVATIVLGTGFSVAKADLPGNRTIKYHIRQTPSDPQSDIIWTVELDISASDSNGESVGWQIGAMHIRDHDTSYSPLRSWIKTSPQVNTPDGLWWVDHADHMDPLASEYDVTPLLEGTAITTRQSGGDLEYSFAGDSYGGSPSYGGKVSGLTFSFILPEKEDPEIEADDEPGEIDEENDPPGGS